MFIRQLSCVSFEFFFYRFANIDFILNHEYLLQRCVKKRIKWRQQVVFLLNCFFTIGWRPNRRITVALIDVYLSVLPRWALIMHFPSLRLRVYRECMSKEHNAVNSPYMQLFVIFLFCKTILRIKLFMIWMLITFIGY